MKKLISILAMGMLFIGCGLPIEPEIGNPYTIDLQVTRSGNIEQHEGYTTINWNAISEDSLVSYICMVSYWTPYGNPGWRDSRLFISLESGEFTTDMIIREVSLEMVLVDESSISEIWLSEGYPDW